MKGVDEDKEVISITGACRINTIETSLQSFFNNTHKNIIWTSLCLCAFIEAQWAVIIEPFHRREIFLHAPVLCCKGPLSSALSPMVVTWCFCRLH